jgi:hypothetical protein
MRLMRSPYYMPPQRLKAATVELDKTAVVRQRLGKHVSAVTNTHEITE